MNCYFFTVYFELIPNYSDFINSDDCMEKITSIFIGLYPFFIQKKISI